jgi:Flp pilus assembly protein TadD/NAD-dependent dihydropyrimidine dehydrogenase PreA subunit
VLIGVHVLIILHLLHWWWKGRTISPVEPSEAMYTLNQGQLNAGFIFFAVAILATLIFGRFFCGWGCHLVAYQDFCGWLMKKLGVKPKPFRSRLLVLAPLALAIYMFVWPTAYRWIVGLPAPELTNHITTTQFWKTFPGAVIAIITFGVCGFAIVYVLGAKGFCTYACPYGGFFGVADKVAPGRIRVTDDCEHCGHCTAVCTSNVRVHEEVARFGMVVDPGCMKCMDCVSVCPNDALYFGFSAKATQPHIHEAAEGRRYDFSLPEELVMVVVGLGALLAYRGLYGQIPLLLAMGMAAITAFLFLKFMHLFRQPNVKIQNKQLRRGGAMTSAGWTFAAFAVLLFSFAAHSGAVQWEIRRGQRDLAAANIGNEVWAPGATWWHDASEFQRQSVDSAQAHFDRARRISLMETPGVLLDVVWLRLARGDLAGAEQTVYRLVSIAPHAAEPHRGLGEVMRLMNRPAEAEQAYRRAIELDETYDTVRGELAHLLVTQKRFDDALRVAHDGEAVSHDPARWRGQAAVLMAQRGVERLQRGESDAGIQSLRDALQRNPDLTEARYNLAVALLARAQAGEAVEHLRRVVQDKPEMAEAHYNLAVGVFMSGRPAEAIPHAREALRLAPDDAQAQGFLKMLEQEVK